MRIFSIAFFNVVLCNLLRIVSRYSLIQQRRPYLAGVNQIFIIPSFAFFFLSFIYLLAILPEYIWKSYNLNWFALNKICLVY
jgi:hypothetical protein